VVRISEPLFKEQNSDTEKMPFYEATGEGRTTA
jgi:hypothetical protein